MSHRARRTTAVMAAAAVTLALAVASASAAPGDLDQRFGRNGIAITYNGSEGRALALQRNRRIVAVGNVGEYGQAIEIDRYFGDGDLDPTFGNGGRASVLDAGDGGIYPATAGIDSQGRIVIAGLMYEEYDSGTDIVVARALPSGDLDTSFGDQGAVLLNPGFNDAAVARLEIRPDDSVLVGGYVGYRRHHSPSAFIAARIDDQGALDPGYGDGGTAIVPLHRESYGYAAAMDVDAKGRATLVERYPWSHRRVRVIRLTRGGELDDSFSGDGSRALNLGRREEVFAVAVGKRGRIYVGGSVAERKPRRTRQTNLALARLNSNGSLDRRFGHDGIVVTDMDRFDYASGLEPQADGKIVASAIGNRFNEGYPQRWAVLRYRKNGKLDRSFSGNGRAFPKIYGAPPALKMQPNGRILLLGWSWGDDVDTDPRGFILARMRNDGRPLGG